MSKFNTYLIFSLLLLATGKIAFGMNFKQTKEIDNVYKISKNGNIAILYNKKQHFSIYDIQKSKIILRKMLCSDKHCKNNPISTVELSEDGNRFAFLRKNDHKIRIYDTKKKQKIFSRQLKEVDVKIFSTDCIQQMQYNQHRHCRFSPNGKYIIVSTGTGNIIMYDIKHKQIIVTSKFLPNPGGLSSIIRTSLIFNFRFNLKENMVAIEKFSKILAYDIKNKNEIIYNFDSKLHNSKRAFSSDIAFSKNGLIIATSYEPNSDTEIYNTKNRHIDNLFKYGRKQPKEVLLSPNGNFIAMWDIAMWGLDRTSKIWEKEEKFYTEMLLIIYDIARGKKIISYQYPYSGSQPIFRTLKKCCFSPDENFLAINVEK